MADNFNLNKFIRNNPLLNESIGGYRDIKPMEEMDYELEKPENIYADEEAEMYGRAWGLAGQQLKSAIDALRQDGFDDEDIKNFLMTGIDMYDQVFDDYDNLEEAEGQFQSFDWNTVDQQGNRARLVVDTGTNNQGEEVIRVGHPNTGGTLAMFTKADILNNDGYLRVGGKNFQVQPSLINWAKS